jgi:UDP-4-amino-4-deoxy-L-arabinose-oxoglutarate aminotransferase
MIAKGTLVETFEAELKRYLGAKFVAATVSGTAGLILALRALGLRRGDEVIIPTYVCPSVFEAVLQSGAEPILCDIGEHWNMTPESVSPYLTKKTKAIVVVHIFGIAADVEGFQKFSIPLIEDCCQALGGEIARKKLGTFGSFGVFSFHATKCLTMGEGGAVVTNDGRLSEIIRALIGRKSVLTTVTDLQAALGLSQLRRYKIFLEKRKLLAKSYLERLPAALTKKLREVTNTMYFRFPLHVGDHDYENVKEFFARNKIAVRKGVDGLLHNTLLSDKGEYRNAEKAFSSTLSLPLYPALSNGEQERICECIQRWDKNRVDLHGPGLIE